MRGGWGRVTRIGIGLGVLGIALALDFVLKDILPDSSIRQLLMLAACNILVALSLNVINGMAGQFSIGHAGFVGLGGYTSAVMASNLHEMLGGGEPTFAHSFIVVPICLLSSALLAGVFGLLVGLPSLRLKGDYLAIVTLGFAEIFRLVIATASAGDTGGPITRALSRLGGQNGYQGIHNQGVPLYAGPFWVFGLAFILGVVAWRIKFSGWGRALRALREDEIAAAAVGVDPTRYKVTSFVIAATGAGIAGGLMAIMRDGTPVVNPDNYNFQSSFDAITMVIIGGSGSVTGSALGGIFITFSIKAIEQVQATAAVQDLKRDFESLDLNALRMIVYAIVLVLLMVWRPEGLLGERELFQKGGVRGSGRKPTMRNAFAFGLLPTLVMALALPVFTAIATSLHVAAISIVGFIVLGVASIWMLINMMLSLDEMRNAADQPGFGRWPIFVPIYNLVYWSWLVPNEIKHAKHKRGIPPTARSGLLYFLFPVFALQQDLNDLADDNDTGNSGTDSTK